MAKHTFTDEQLLSLVNNEPNNPKRTHKLQNLSETLRTNKLGYAYQLQKVQ